MMSISSNSVGAFCIIFFGYILQSSVLQYVYYCKDRNIDKWKIQSDKRKSVGQFFGFPLFSSKPDRGENHYILTFVNLLIASCFALFATEASIRGLNNMQFDKNITIVRIISELVFAITYQCIAEYYWHRMMHLKQFYATFHKIHHFYKSPEPWDDMYIHPLEAFGYYCILYGPPFLFKIHYISFIWYMIILGLCGVLDHSGIIIQIPGLYNTIDHDNHHAKFEVNYSFPFPFMDILHSTFEGEYLGYKFTRKIKKR